MFTHLAPAIFYASRDNSVLSQLLSFGGLTFYKNYTNTSSVNADYSSGSPTGTFTASRGISNPATYLDSNGIIQQTIASNTPRYSQTYYDSSGVHSRSYLMIESAKTNLLLRSDGTSSSSGLWTGWTSSAGALSATPTTSQLSVNDLSSLSGSNAQRVQYTGQVADVNAGCTTFLRASDTGAGTVSPGDFIVASFWYKLSLSGVTNFKIYLVWRDVSPTDLSNASSTLSDTGGVWVRKTLTATAPASTDRVAFRIQIDNGVDNGDTIDFSIYGPQIEKNSLSSWIPTAASAITRNEEKLLYATSGNRVAATESGFSKYFTGSSGSSFASNAYISSTETSDQRRMIAVLSSSGRARFQAKAGLSAVDSSVTATANQVFIFGYRCKTTGDPNQSLFIDGSETGTPNNTDFTANSFGTNFSVGSDEAANNSIDGGIMNIAFFNRVLSDYEMVYVTSILNS